MAQMKKERVLTLDCLKRFSYELKAESVQLKLDKDDDDVRAVHADLDPYVPPVVSLIVLDYMASFLKVESSLYTIDVDRDHIIVTKSPCQFSYSKSDTLDNNSIFSQRSNNVTSGYEPHVDNNEDQIVTVSLLQNN